MALEIVQEVLDMIEAEANSRPTAFEFELAYQARVAIDRIRFAIQHTEKCAPRTDHMCEAGLQLLDALDRLQSAERRFQRRFRPQVAHNRVGKIDSKVHVNAGPARGPHVSVTLARMQADLDNAACRVRVLSQDLAKDLHRALAIIAVGSLILGFLTGASFLT